MHWIYYNEYLENKESQLELLYRIIKEKLTVKETETIINANEIDEKEINPPLES